MSEVPHWFSTLTRRGTLLYLWYLAMLSKLEKRPKVLQDHISPMSSSTRWASSSTDWEDSLHGVESACLNICTSWYLICQNSKGLKILCPFQMFIQNKTINPLSKAKESPLRIQNNHCSGKKKGQISHFSSPFTHLAPFPSLSFHGHAPSDEQMVAKAALTTELRPPC